MKKCPASVRVGPYTFKIVTPCRDSNNWGEFDSVTHEIRLHQAFPGPHKMVETVLHELSHALWYAGGMGAKAKEEKAVRVLSIQLTQVMRDNPELFDWLREMVRR